MYSKSCLWCRPKWSKWTQSGESPQKHSSDLDYSTNDNTFGVTLHLSGLRKAEVGLKDNVKKRANWCTQICKGRWDLQVSSLPPGRRTFSPWVHSILNFKVHLFSAFVFVFIFVFSFTCQKAMEKKWNTQSNATGMSFAKKIPANLIAD